MIKKIIPVILSFSLLLCTNVLAQQETNASITQEAPSSNEFMQNDNRRPSANQLPSEPSEMPNGQANAPAYGEDAPAQNQDTSNIPGNFNSGWNRNNTQTTQNIPTQSGNNENAGGQGFGNVQNMPQFGGQAPDFGGNMGSGMNGFPGNMQNGTQNEQQNQETGFSGFIKTNFTPVISAVLLVFAFLFVIFYKRKKF